MTQEGFEIVEGIVIDYPKTTVKEINIENLELSADRIFISYTEPPKLPTHTKGGLRLTEAVVREIEMRLNNNLEYLEGKVLLIGKKASEETGIHVGDIVLFTRGGGIIAEIGGVKGHMCEKHAIVGKKL